MPAMTMPQAQAFATFLRCRLPYPEGESDHRLYAFTTYARAVLKRPELGQWRDLTEDEARVVMDACRGAYPKLREAWEHPRVGNT